MKPKSYPQGSEWRKWDLQVQTRLDDNYTCLGNGSLTREQLDTLIAATGLTEAEITSQEKTIPADKYAKLFIKYVELFTDISVIAITDHNTGEELDFLINEAKTATREITIIPGVELSSNHGIHILCLFDPLKPWRGTSWKDSIDHFLTEVGITGQRFNEQNQPINTTATTQEIFELTNAKGGLCICAHIGTQNGLFYQTNTANGGTAHIDIYTHQGCKVVQLPHTSTISTGVDNIINGREPRYGNKTVAQIKCSDSRKLTEIGSQFVWIKANPTFEGLRQITFEPTERIKIQDDKPEQKRPYFLIEKVRFIDNTGKQNFAPDYIPLNQNLSTVIGGKSTGKSLFLYYIAKTVDETEVYKASTLGEDTTKHYSFDDENDFDFEVVWKDGESTNLRRTPGDSDGSPRKIIYIPQHYLNLLSEKEIQSKQTLNAFIQNIILQDKTASEFNEQKKLDISKAEKDISKELNNLFSLQEDIEKLKSELKALGDEKGISRYIDELKKKIEQAKKKTGLKKDELEKYEQLVGQIKALEEENTKLSQDKKSLQEFSDELKGRIESDDLLEEYQEYLSNDAVRQQFLNGFAFVKKLPKEVDVATKKLVTSIEDKIKANTNALAPLNKELAPLIAKVKLQSELEKQQKLLKDEEEKLNSVQTKKKNLQAKKKTFDTRKGGILKLYESIFVAFESMQGEFRKYSSRLKDIDLTITVGFNESEFNREVVEQFLNKNSLKQLPDANSSWNEKFEYIYAPQNHLKFITSVFESILDGKVSTIRNRMPKDALQKLLDNKFYVDFKISYKNDSLDKMSPGKKGLVLLKILVDLSDEEWPIILDQPEDDLDNRSVYTDLVTFIKSKKKERQILIATHNPNLVVGADAEEIVVANQDGQEIGRENARFKFEYISGALEDSFKDDAATSILNKMGIRQHVCDVLEGGEEAFQKREQEYNL